MTMHRILAPALVVALGLLPGCPKDADTSTSGDSQPDTAEADEDLPDVVKHARAARAAYDAEDYKTAAAHLSSVLARDTLDPASRANYLWFMFELRERLGERKGQLYALQQFVDVATQIPDDQVPSGMHLMDMLQTARLFLLADTAIQVDAVGASLDEAVVVWSPDDQYFFLESTLCGGARGVWRRALLAQQTEKGRKYEKITTRCSSNEDLERVFYFDITTWQQLLDTVQVGAEPPEGFSEADAERIVEAALTAKE